MLVCRIVDHIQLNTTNNRHIVASGTLQGNHTGNVHAVSGNDSSVASVSRDFHRVFCF
ncbi:hypothetical protein M476_4232 (plasmid) [Yersinia pestis 1670]|nr:hypothetical protein M476_4232 [Yersinia pestis 1670]